jgi:hypothetical protein
VFLAAASQRSRRIRLGHGIVLMPPGYPRASLSVWRPWIWSRAAESTGGQRDPSRAELEGFGLNPAERRAMWRRLANRSPI